MAVDLSTNEHSVISSAMTREQTHQERELRFDELRSYPHSFGTEGALKEMGAWIDNPDSDVRAFVAQKMTGADNSDGYYDGIFKFLLGDEDALVRCQAAKSSSSIIIDTSTIPLLMDMIRNKDSAADRFFALETLQRMQRWYEPEIGWEITDWIEIREWIEIRSLLLDDDLNVRGVVAKLLTSNISFVRWLAGHCEKDVMDALQFYHEPPCSWPPDPLEVVWSPVHYYFGIDIQMGNSSEK
jgi:hypothetical protein